jgi:outer membrane protein
MKRLASLCWSGACASLARHVPPSPTVVLTLDEALALARANHPQLHASRAQTEASAARSLEAKAPLLPQVTGWHRTYAALDVGYVCSRGALPKNWEPRPKRRRDHGLVRHPTATSTAYGVALPASSSTILARPPESGTRPRRRFRSQEESERNFAVQVGFNSAFRVLHAAAARALLKVAQETLRIKKPICARSKVLSRRARGPRSILAQARTDRANAKVQLINAEVAYDTDKALLNQAMGVERGTDYDVADPAARERSGEGRRTDDLARLRSRLVRILLSLARQIEAQELTTRSIKGGYAPSLGASASLNESGADAGCLDWGFRGTSRSIGKSSAAASPTRRCARRVPIRPPCAPSTNCSVSKCAPTWNKRGSAFARPRRPSRRPTRRRRMRASG